LVKRATDKDTFTAAYLTASCVLYAPPALYFALRTSIPFAGWLCIIASGTLYSLYFLALGRAYFHGDLSVIYPVARGVGPVLTAIAGHLILGERVTAAGAAGIALIAGSVFALQVPVARPDREGAPVAALLWAGCVGALYAAYSIIDKQGVGVIRVHPFVYVYFAYVVSALIVIPLIVLRHGLRRTLREWWKDRTPAVLVGLLNLGAYTLVLIALSLPRSPVSYVVPLRTASVLVGVLAGIRVLKEEGAVVRIAAACLVMVGVALIAWKG